MEQNALPGITNRILGKFVDKIFLTFPDREKWFPEKKTIVFGNPVRSAFLSGSLEKNKSVGKFTILIFGGSQGAHAINMAVVNALPHLRGMHKELRIIHQTGERELNHILKDYEKYDMDAEVVPFILDMAAAYRSADLLICRAGATSIAEITASGKASILIPFPFAANDHQTKNAEVLVKAGAAMMIHENDLSGQRLVETIGNMVHNPEIIKVMENNSARLGNTGAASEIVNHCIKMTI
jgi:UDP-N-acetylglucosamine--N-acetylmuramyl-(pentapeptide) pyrophosphoryl-undecaprenol N-acetylglucosamine transferase